MRTIGAVVLIAALASASAEAQNPRARLLVNGLYSPTSQSFTEVVTFRSFLEEATSTRSYDRGTGLAFEAGVIFGITSSLGVMGTFELYEGAIDASFRESLPHPLFFDRPRILEGQLPGLSYTEHALHLDAVFTREISSMIVDLFGGPTLFFTNAQVVSMVSSSSEYPFDEVQLASAETVELSDDPVGFNLGGSLTYRLSPTFGVAFQARYSRASIGLASTSGRTIELHAGGFRAGGGLRVAF